MTGESLPLDPKVLRPVSLDDTDRQIVRILSRDARTSNADVAAAVGIAPSTAHARTRALVDRGVIRGFHASVDHGRLGRGLQAMIGVTLRGGTRHDSIVTFIDEVKELPPVLQLFFLGGTDDFMVHIAVADSSEVRQFVVENLSTEPFVASTRTSIIFEYHRRGVAAGFR
ncbi:Lrp/AsnC family transcriptional regulator [Microbacterium excoecariae]|uniref:Lrp/AsnC family transcriptional regulator n=1 Tax=Microbacterium excoecariae TaxID=2715210 RepID=UPI001409BC4F|nr:Lrp/AsnC family transcriptional regulator [Microbacterium excoecariae]NHI15947.1 Lrp/AsnC family transcriptional regulator [Microbacterium excoecariae]